MRNIKVTTRYPDGTESVKTMERTAAVKELEKHYDAAAAFKKATRAAHVVYGVKSYDTDGYLTGIVMYAEPLKRVAKEFRTMTSYYHLTHPHSMLCYI